MQQLILSTAGIISLSPDENKTRSFRCILLECDHHCSHLELKNVVLANNDYHAYVMRGIRVAG